MVLGALSRDGESLLVSEPSLDNEAQSRDQDIASTLTLVDHPMDSNNFFTFSELDCSRLTLLILSAMIARGFSDSLDNLCTDWLVVPICKLQVCWWSSIAASSPHVMILLVANHLDGPYGLIFQDPPFLGLRCLFIDIDLPKGW